MDIPNELQGVLVCTPVVTKEQAEAVLKWEQNQSRKTFGLDLVA